MTFKNHFFMAMAVAGLAGCSAGVNSSPAKVKVSIPALRSAVRIASVASVPSALADFDCVALTVTGQGIETTKGLGVVSNLVAAVTGGTLEVSVPTGPARNFQVLGLVASGGTCPESVNKASLISNSAFPTITTVGSKEADISGDTTITIRGAYAPSTAVDIRTGVKLAGGGGGGGGTGGGDVNCASQAAEFAGGDGSAGNPFLIETVDQWNKIGTNEIRTKCSYRLTENLDFDGQAPVQIGGRRSSNMFKGTFDGGGKTISNGIIPILTTDGDDNYGGIFSMTNTEIKNLNVDNFSVALAPSDDANTTIGVVVGSVYGGAVLQNLTVSNASITMSGGLQADRPRIGGIVGLVDTGDNVVTDVQVSNLTVNLSSDAEFGGITSKVSAGSVARAWLKNLNVTLNGPAGDVGGAIGEANVDVEDIMVDGFTVAHTEVWSSIHGGVIGVLAGAKTLRRSAALNLSITADAESQTGGLVGNLWNGKVVDSHASGTLTTLGKTGGAIGSASSCPANVCFERVYVSTLVTNAGSLNRNAFLGYKSLTEYAGLDSFYDSDRQATGSAGATGVAALDQAGLLNADSFSTWDSSTIWNIVDGNYPQLKSLADWYDPG